MPLSLNDIRLFYFIFLLIFLFFIDSFVFFFIALNWMETYRVDRESDSESIWDSLDGGKVMKLNNQTNSNVDSEEFDYIEQDVETTLEEDANNAEDYLWWNCYFRFEHFHGQTLASAQDHLILKEKLTGIYKYLKKRNKYESDFLEYHAANFLKKKYHRAKFYNEVSVLNLDIARDVTNVKFFSKYKYLEYKKTFNNK